MRHLHRIVHHGTNILGLLDILAFVGIVWIGIYLLSNFPSVLIKILTGSCWLIVIGGIIVFDL